MKFTTKALALCASVAALIGAMPQRVEAQATMLDCPASGTISLEELEANFGGSCKGTPTVYGLTFYEMGLCQSDPMASGTLDRAAGGCFATFENASGEYHDIAGASVTLGSDEGTERPGDGTYNVAYVIIANQFTLEGSYAFTANSAGAAAPFTNLAGATYASNGLTTPNAPGDPTNITAGGTPTTFTELLTSFAGSTTCDPDWAEPQNNGTLNAYIASGSISSGLTTDTSCSTSASTIVGALVLNSPITIDSATTGLQVDFSVTNNGMSIFSQNDGPGGFGSGPFSATFTVLE